FDIDRVEVLNNGAAVVEPHTGIDRQPLSDRHGFGCEKSSRNELPAVDPGTAGDRLKGLAVVVDEPRAGRNDLGLAMLTLFDLCADLPLVIGPKQPALVVAERRLRCRANQCQRADLLRSPAVDTGYLVSPIRYRDVTGTRIVRVRID